MRVAIGVAALVLLGSPALAQSSDGGQTVVPAKPKKICHKVEMTGRRISSSVCHTADEWHAQEQADEENSRKLMAGAMDQMSRSRFGAGPNGGSDSLAGTGMGVQ